MPEIIYNILLQGHYVNITTNGTINKRFDELIKFPKDLLNRLHFSFSFHYLELKRLNKLEDFFNNIKKVRNAGCSILVQLNLCDEYIPYLNEIKKLCKQNVGALPQLAATRNELGKNITLRTDYKFKEYIKFARQFKSPLFKFTIKNFMIKRHEFCYAGDWSAILDLSTGEMKKCYACGVKTQNIFQNIDKDIKFEPIGNLCRSPYCVNSSHFMSLGVIPSISTPSYAQLRNRKVYTKIKDGECFWYTEQMAAFLNSKLNENNKEYNSIAKLKINITNILLMVINKLKQIFR